MTLQLRRRLFGTCSPMRSTVMVFKKRFYHSFAIAIWLHALEQKCILKILILMFFSIKTSFTSTLEGVFSINYLANDISCFPVSGQVMLKKHSLNTHRIRSVSMRQQWVALHDMRMCVDRVRNSLSDRESQLEQLPREKTSDMTEIECWTHLSYRRFF